MLTLAFDTNFSGFSLALASDDKIIYQNAIFENGRQSELLIPEIEKLLQINKITYRDLDLIAATNGPGSFTGTRIGLTAARTIRLATNLPLVLVNSCEAIAYKYRQKSEKIFVLIDAKADDFFYSHNGKEPQLVKLEDLLKILPKEKFFLCGSGKNIAAEILKTKNSQFEMSENTDEIEAGFVALLAYKEFKKSGEGSKNLDPLYLRSPKISERKK
jgi:tRNA threonylcarbamoyladenosine biosynthesis protein TsaB